MCCQLLVYIQLLVENLLMVHILLHVHVHSASVTGFMFPPIYLGFKKLSSYTILNHLQLAKIKAEDEVQDEIEFLEKLLEQSLLK